MEKRFLAVAALALALAAFTIVEKEVYIVDVNNSTLKWTGYHLAKSYEHSGNVKLKSGSLELAGDKITRGTFVIDMTSITNTDMEGDKATKLENHLKNEDFFYVEKYPEAKLVITKIRGNQAEGDITIRGITEPISFNFESNAIDGGVEATAKLSIDRTKHEVSYGWTVENAVLSNEFTLEVNIVASK